MVCSLGLVPSPQKVVRPPWHPPQPSSQEVVEALGVVACFFFPWGSIKYRTSEDTAGPSKPTLCLQSPSDKVQYLDPAESKRSCSPGANGSSHSIWQRSFSGSHLDLQDHPRIGGIWTRGSVFMRRNLQGIAPFHHGSQRCFIN